jgi:hypothetical protein
LKKFGGVKENGFKTKKRREAGDVQIRAGTQKGYQDPQTKVSGLEA